MPLNLDLGIWELAEFQLEFGVRISVLFQSIDVIVLLYLASLKKMEQRFGTFFHFSWKKVRKIRKKEKKFVACY